MYELNCFAKSSIQPKTMKTLSAAAEQAVAVDAALRPQDRGVFEIWKRPQCLPDLEWRRN